MRRLENTPEMYNKQHYTPHLVNLQSFLKPLPNSDDSSPKESGSSMRNSAVKNTKTWQESIFIFHLTCLAYPILCLMNYIENGIQSCGGVYKKSDRGRDFPSVEGGGHLLEKKTVSQAGPIINPILLVLHRNDTDCQNNRGC